MDQTSKTSEIAKHLLLGHSCYDCSYSEYWNMLDKSKDYMRCYKTFLIDGKTRNTDTLEICESWRNSTK